MFSLKKITIDNFRAFRHLNISFEDSKLIILKGENGLGKTSLLDSIEWCITGDIKRLHNSFNSRAENKKTELKRVSNKKGILKNKECNKDDNVKVSLQMEYKNEYITISRERNEDTLDINEEFIVHETDISIELEEKIENLRNEKSIYNYNYCDLEKTNNFMNSSRTDLRKALKDFFEDRGEIERLLKDLNDEKDSKNKLLEKDKEELGKKKSSKDELILKRSKILADKTSLIYPDRKAFDGESLEEDIDYKKLKKEIEMWGYWKVNRECATLEYNEKSETEIRYIENIKNEYRKNNKIINEVIEKKLYEKSKRDDTCTRLESLIRDKKRCSEWSNIERQSFEIDEKTEKLILEKKQKYYKIAENIRDIDESINLIGENNKLFIALNKLILAKDELINEYIDKGNTKCPLCGVDGIIDKLPEDEICKEALIYLNTQNKIKNHLIATNENQKIQKRTLQNEIMESLKKYYDEKIIDLEIIKDREDILWDGTKQFFIKLDKKNIQKSNNLDKELDRLKNNYLKGMKTIEELDECKKSIKNILSVLDKLKLNDFENGEYKKLEIETEGLYNKDKKYNEFSLETMNLKLHCLNNYIALDEIKEITKEIISLEKEVDSYDKRISENGEIYINLDVMIKEIGDNLRKIETQEIEEIGPYLYKIFCKLIKHTNISTFKFVRDKSINNDIAGINLLDAEGNNIPNMFSNGQLGVFMVSYFIGNILKRGNKNNLSTFFIDDITSCFDDINIIAFIDLLKYILHDERNGMKQLFFATCNKNIEVLLKNRMDSFNIQYKIIEFQEMGRIVENKNIEELEK